ncbi:MAG: DedA family protein [Xanthobacteraceae bacterium]
MFGWITEFVEKSGYFGIALLMFAENVFPPLPSELIMPLAGFAAARGDLNLLLVTAAGTAGSVAGALLWYGIGYWLGFHRLKRFASRHGRWLTLSPNDIDDAQRFFLRHCGKAVLLGRLVPAVRTIISIPAGIVGMGIAKFLLYSMIGSAIWTGLLAAAGYLLGAEYAKVGEWLRLVTNITVGGAIVLYAYRVITFRPRESR